MSNDSVEPFPDNWTYLKAELNWLDRVLSLAVAKQRKDMKEVERLARTRADRATSHWWKGLVSLEGEVAYDSPVEAPRRRAGKGGYQQQLEAKVGASQQQGICLGLPTLQRRLQLSMFEKNLVLMVLAPEISRRYGQLYNYLQETEQSGASGLPTVDLLLRILCRNDTEWRLGRQYLMTKSALLQHQLLEVRSQQTEPLLTRLVKLSDPLVNFLLADQPEAADLDRLIQSESSFTCVARQDIQQSDVLSHPTSALLSGVVSTRSWSSLVLPESLLDNLKHLSHQLQALSQVDEAWGFQTADSPHSTGAIALFIGESGTGKTVAAGAIAHALETPLVIADLALLEAETQMQLLYEIAEQSPTVLLLKNAPVWLGEESSLSAPKIQQFLKLRQQSRSITVLTVHHKPTVKLQWRQQMSCLEFPRPGETSRLKLWQQAFPPQVPLDAEIDWNLLARRYQLTGGEIMAIARESAFYAAAESPHAKLAMKHLLQALKTRGIAKKF